ncbi:hypothetical protein [Streptomyces sp. NPDC059906]
MPHPGPASAPPWGLLAAARRIPATAPYAHAAPATATPLHVPAVPQT